jgi:sigma-B regulation protein RsbU (phosphoserine phosphatase)
MIKVRNMLKKALLKNPPAKALHLVNEELFDHGKNNIPLKAFLGILNLRSGVLLTFNAGHVDPVIKSKNGNTGFIKGPFIPLLGASADSAFIPMTLQLNAGDNVYFYSNDTIELSNGKGEKYGRDRLLDIISFSGNNVQEIIKSICQDVTDFTGTSSLNADIAIAVLEYTPAER